MNDFDPWTVGEIKDYQKLIKDFGMEDFQKYQVRFDSFRYVRRGLIFGHRSFSDIVDAIDKKKPFAMMTGLMPSGVFHFGHKMVADEIIWLQSMGAQTYICAADVESYLMRDIPFDKAKQTAADEYLANYLALGLKPENLRFWLQSSYIKQYYRLRDMASKRVTFNELKAIYGELSPGKIVSVLTQVADILHPQLPMYGGPKPVVVPCGADQDPHIRLTRDIASRLAAKRGDDSKKSSKKQADFKCVPPGALYHKFQGGLQGGKMSSSDEKSYIGLADDPKVARKKVMRAKTGGRETVDEQRQKGGTPESCTVYELYLYHLVEDDLELSKIYHECVNGSILCGECKNRCADMVEKFLTSHQKKLKKALPLAEKIVEESI